MLQTHKETVLDLLRDNRHLVEALRDSLLEREEILGDEIMEVLDRAERAHAKA
jgi:ATP-dependent Zn protease